MLDSRDVLDRVEAEKAAFLETLMQYLRFPSISAGPAFHGQVLACSEFVVAQLRATGFDAKTIDFEEGNPLVYAEWLGAPGQPTLLFYGHYDVQPPDPLDQWRHDPFDPTIEGDLLVARGATDDKGQHYAHIAAITAMMRERGCLPVNVKFLIEGEEETGGKNIEAFLRSPVAPELLRCDGVVVSDTSMFAPGKPALTYGLRGLCYMEVKVTGPNRDLHSGTYGGTVRNPVNALAHILGRLHDPESGRVLVPRFYKDVSDLKDWERQEFATLPFDEPAYCQELGIEAVAGEHGYTTRERAWGRPTLDVNGIWGGYAGEGAKTILPATAGAKVSMRLVPDQGPEIIARLFTDFVRRISPRGVRVEVSLLHGASPVLVDIQGPIAAAAMAAQEDIWGVSPVRIREGGSIPVVRTFGQVLKVPVLLMGLGLESDRLHSPNEKFNISHFYNGIRIMVRLLDRVGAAPNLASVSTQVIVEA